MKMLDRCALPAIIIFLVSSLSLYSVVSPVIGQKSSAYDFTVRAFCKIRGEPLSLPIWMDGEWTDYKTPHTFKGLSGLHRINVPPEDGHGHFVHPFSPSAEGVLIGNSSLFSIQFNYTRSPSVSYLPFDPDFQLGESVLLSSLIGVADTRVSHINITLFGPKINFLHPSTILFQNIFTITGPSFEIGIPVPVGTPIGEYVLVTSGITNGQSWSLPDIDCSVQPVSVSFPLFETLSHVSTFQIEDIQYRYYQNPFSDSAVIFIGRGQFSNLIGGSVIRGPPSVGDRGSATYRLVYDLVINGLSVVAPSSEWAGVDFPAKVVNRLKGEGIKKFYIIGWSSGGIVAANSIIDNPILFKKAVIADTLLTSSSEDSLTYLAPRASKVSIPHYLIWGEADPIVSAEEAYEWIQTARPDLVKFKMFEYFHDWDGAEAELQIRDLIVSFLTGRTLTSHQVTFEGQQYQFHARTNGWISNVSYDGQRLNMHIDKNSLNQGGATTDIYSPQNDVFIVPKAILRSTVSILVDEQQIPIEKLENATHYFFFFDYPPGGYEVMIMGSEPIPEFNPTLLLILIFMAMLILLTTKNHPNYRLLP